MSEAPTDRRKTKELKMTAEIYTRFISLPLVCGGFTLPDPQGGFNIYINSRLSQARQKTAFRHEIDHIKNDDFSKPLPAGVIEALALARKEI